MTDQKDRFTSELVRECRTDYITDHHADDEYCLCEVFEIGTITDQVPLQTDTANSKKILNKEYTVYTTADTTYGKVIMKL